MLVYEAKLPVDLYQHFNVVIAFIACHHDFAANTKEGVSFGET